AAVAEAAAVAAEVARADAGVVEPQRGGPVAGGLTCRIRQRRYDALVPQLQDMAELVHGDARALRGIGAAVARTPEPHSGLECGRGAGRGLIDVDEERPRKAGVAARGQPASRQLGGAVHPVRLRSRSAGVAGAAGAGDRAVVAW